MTLEKKGTGHPVLLRAGPAVAVILGLTALCSTHGPPPQIVEAQAGDTIPLEWSWLSSQAKNWDDITVNAHGPLNKFEGQGATLYKQLCASCHGLKGDGQGELAASLAVRPRDFTKEWFRFRSVKGDGHARPEDLYRTISAGVQASAMPSFDHLSPDKRWALVAHVMKLSITFQQAPKQGRAIPKIKLLPEDGASVERGRGVYKRLQCAKCHGQLARGDGISALTLKDDMGHPIKVPNITQGFHVFKTGGSAQGLARLLLTGLPGTPMPSFESSFTGMNPQAAQDLSDLVYYIRSLARKGDESRKRRWIAFFRKKQQWAPLTGEHPHAKQVQRFKDPSAFAHSEKAGCVSCHDGIAHISTGTMAVAIEAFAGGDKNRSCVVCHEGNAGTRSKAVAHRAMIANPGSLWVTSIGLGCGKCHSNHNALTSLHGQDLPEAVGGMLMAAVSKKTDPTGKSGSNHAYRMQRGLMALETGKVTHVMRSGSLLALDKFKFADFDVDDPDGPEPCSGTEVYKAFMKKAKAAGKIVQKNRLYRLPNFEEALAISGPDEPAAAAYADYYRKECGRCHLWGEGLSSFGEHRSAGCSACHIVYSQEALYEGKDKTIPKDQAPHMRRHELVLAPPTEQCNHCHTRGQTTEKHELHTVAGMVCADCHTSIDVHGDGNLYPTIPYQLEIRCMDCHGTRKSYPWELPVGVGNGIKMKGQRGVHKQDGIEYLLTSRGNPSTNWRRVDGQVVIKSMVTGKEFYPLLLKDLPANPDLAEMDTPVKKGTPKFRDPRQTHNLKHMDQLECYACHYSKAPRCITCHVDYFQSGEAVDYVQSGLRFNPKSGRQTLIKTPGEPRSRQRYATMSKWVPGVYRQNKHGKTAPFVEGCEVHFMFFNKDMSVRKPLKITTNPFGKHYPTGLGPTMAHEYERPTVNCAVCHEDPVTGKAKKKAPQKGKGQAKPKNKPKSKTAKEPVNEPGKKAKK